MDSVKVYDALIKSKGEPVVVDGEKYGCDWLVATVLDKEGDMIFMVMKKVDDPSSARKKWLEQLERFELANMGDWEEWVVVAHNHPASIFVWDEEDKRWKWIEDILCEML